MRARILLLAALAAGCTAGPDYAGPPATPSSAGFVRADRRTVVAPALARWWEALGDPTLTALVDDALAHNPTIDQATARVREAEAQLRQQRAGRLPSVSGNATYIRAELPGVGLGQSDQQGAANGGTSLDFYNLGLNASWEVDLFGGGRRTVEQSRATAGARVADLADAQVTLSAQVAQAYVALRGLQERIRLNAATVTAQRRQLDLSRQRFVQGAASRLDLERLQRQLEGTEADAIPLGAQLDEQRNLLATLTGRVPGALDATLGPVIPVPLPPAQVAIADPAALIAHRPDIRAAERELAAATAGIGVSKARELPGIRFLGLLGLGGTRPGDVFDLGNLTALAAPSLNWSFLDFGRARAATRVSQAQADRADAAYRQAVLDGLRDAEDSLSRFGSTRAQLAQLVRAEATARRADALNRQRVSAGTASVIDQLDVERQLLAARIATVQARAQLAQSYIAVNKALGLGWTDPATDPVTGAAAR